MVNKEKRYALPKDIKRHTPRICFQEDNVYAAKNLLVLHKLGPSAASIAHRNKSSNTTGKVALEHDHEGVATRVVWCFASLKDTPSVNTYMD